MIVVPLAKWPDYFPRVRRRRPAERTWAGHRLLTLEEQLEIQRARREGATIAALAERYGISRRTVDRYTSGKRHLQPPDPILRGRLFEWAREREIRLTTDDMATLVALLERHFAGSVLNPESR